MQLLISGIFALSCLASAIPFDQNHHQAYPLRRRQNANADQSSFSSEQRFTQSPSPTEASAANGVMGVLKDGKIGSLPGATATARPPYPGQGTTANNVMGILGKDNGETEGSSGNQGSTGEERKTIDEGEAGNESSAEKDGTTGDQGTTGDHTAGNQGTTGNDTTGNDTTGNTSTPEAQPVGLSDAKDVVSKNLGDGGSDSTSGTDLQQCGSQKFHPNMYTCYANSHLCPIEGDAKTLPCGDACYDPAKYGCSNDNLYPKGAPKPGEVSSDAAKGSYNTGEGPPDKGESVPSIGGSPSTTSLYHYAPSATTSSVSLSYSSPSSSMAFKLREKRRRDG